MLNIVIPAAGKGQRFADAGYAEPKPLIDVCGMPMIQRVMVNLRPEDRASVTHLITRKEHDIPSAVYLDHETEGAACTVLEAAHIIDNEDPLIIANCDQLLMNFRMEDFLNKMDGEFGGQYAGGIITFNSTNPHHSYVQTDLYGVVTKVAEKVVISDQAVAGIYYFRHGSDFVKYARQMIEKNIRTNNEFYITPVYAELLADGKIIGTYEIDVKDKHMLGTPDELNIFLDKVASGKVLL